MLTSTLKTNRALPDFIKRHDIFNQFKRIDKIFPKIGLKNCSARTSVADLIKLIGRQSLQDPELCKNLRIVFSANDKRGAWDIATMSMRGISSCQSWENLEHRGHLIGSIADPYTGIIYIANNFNCSNYGSEMLFRAIIRYAIDNKSKKPVIFIERIYCGEMIKSASLEIKKTIANLFVKFVANKINNKIKVTTSSVNLVIPKSKIVSNISTFIYADIYDDSHDCLSYRDSNIDYGKSKKTYFRGIAGF